MIEHSTFGIKLLVPAGKSILALIFVILIEPVYDFIVLQVDHYAMLSQYTKDLLGDIKLIIVLLTAFIVLIKVSVSTIKMIKEFKKK